MADVGEKEKLTRIWSQHKNKYVIVRIQYGTSAKDERVVQLHSVVEVD